MLHAVRHGLDEGLVVHGGVEQEGTAFLQVRDDVELEDVGVKGAGDEVRVLDVVFGMDGLLAEAEVAASRTARFAGVILEVGLGILAEISKQFFKEHTIIENLDDGIGEE